MAVKLQERVRGAIATVGEEITEKAWKAGRGRKAERRRRIQWGILQGAIAAVFTLGARRVGAKLWGVLTGERPPARK